MALYSARGERKYLNSEERQRALAAVEKLSLRPALFVLTLAWTGARVSEVLALCPASFMLESGIVTFRTLKRRRFAMREVPIPPHLADALDAHFEIAKAQRDPASATRPLWSCCRQSAWRYTKAVMAEAGVTGRRASPRGFRHSFGVTTLSSGVPLTLVQRWLGHASVSSTAIYTDAMGPEEVAFAGRFWAAGIDAHQCGGLPGGA